MVYTEFISEIETFNVNNIVFSKVKDGGAGFRRISIYAKNGPDKSPLYIQMGERLCFGVQPSYDMADKTTVNGYQLAVPMWDKEGKTEEQDLFYRVFRQIGTKCMEYLTTPAVKKELKKHTLTIDSISEKFMPTWYKRDDMGNKTSDSPTLYIKLLTHKEPEMRITTEFADSEGERIEPLTLLNSIFKMQRCLLQIHSIYIGATIKLQVKAIEVEIEKKKKRIIPLMLKRRSELEDSLPNDNEDDSDEHEKENEYETIDEDVKEDDQGYSRQEYSEAPKFANYQPPTPAPSTSTSPKPVTPIIVPELQPEIITRKRTTRKKI